MKREFTVTWLIFGALLFFAEFFAVQYLADYIRSVCIGIFVIAEGWAIGRPKKGDMLTEHVRAFYRQEPARLPLVAAFALYLPITLANIVSDPDLAVRGFPLGALVLCLGLVGWLVPHFLDRGADE